jgi:phosphoribosylaminoimidazole-succinocarboxamide synthase
MNAIKDTNFNFPGQRDVYHGKVRDVYFVKEKLIAVASDRISAFDHILPKPIPYKGQVLNQIAAYFLNATKDICPNWLESVPDPNVSIGKKCEPIRLEMVIRGYLAGHSAREYKSGKRTLCGVPLPEGMKENGKFPSPIITPAAKNMEDHDEDASREEILKQGIVTDAQYAVMEKYTYALFARGTEMAAKQGLILVDTKYEFGFYDGAIYLIDEIHTPDSSRYFYAEGYGERQAKGEAQKQLSKEFVREWLMANNFSGKDGQQMPAMPDEFVQTITDRYIELYERITGLSFDRAPTVEVLKRIEKNILAYLGQ